MAAARACPVSAIAAAAIASSVVTPISGIRRPSRSPRMKAKPTRWPVNVPGPVVTARRSSAENSTSAAFIAASHIAARRPERCRQQEAADDLTGFVEGQALIARAIAAFRAIAQIAEEVGLDLGAGE